jgi:hypothetical protein
MNRTTTNKGNLTYVCNLACECVSAQGVHILYQFRCVCVCVCVVEDNTPFCFADDNLKSTDGSVTFVMFSYTKFLLSVHCIISHFCPYLIDLRCSFAAKIVLY